jgi:hypothetical protein
MRRLGFSILVGTLVTVLLAVLSAFFPFCVGKILFWPAALFITYVDEEMGAGFYYMIGVPLAIPFYSLLSYVCLALLGLPRAKASENGE